MGFKKPKKAIGLDMGTHSVKAVLMARVGGRLRLERAEQVLVDRNLVNNDPVAAQAMAVREALRSMPVSQAHVVAALAGQTVVVRYPRLANVSRDQIETAVMREAGHNIPYDLNDVFLDWSVLDETKTEEQRQVKLLLVAAKHEVIDGRMQIFQAAEVPCGVLGVDSLALADAAEACDFLRVGETVAMVNIGLTSASVHFVKDGTSNFIREVNWGSREMIQAIAKDRRCSYEDAVRQLEEFILASADDLPAPVAEVVEIPDIPEIPEAQEIPLASPIGTSPVQTYGDASLLDPLDDEFDDTPSAPKKVGASDSFLIPPSASGRGMEEVLAAPLTRMAAEFRRSFDFYEHQLYEQPVNRILLCGGVSRMSMIRDTLRDELGIEDIEPARPEHSALLLGDQDAVSDLLQESGQFMVAVGLAARGMADL